MNEDNLPETIDLLLPNGLTRTFPLSKYLSAKLICLQKFGYENLTLQELRAEFRGYWQNGKAETAVQMFIEQDDIIRRL